MRIFDWRGLVVGAVVVSCAMVSFNTTARAGDDCEAAAFVGPWEVDYDSLCEQAISRLLRVSDQHAIRVLFSFSAGSTQRLESLWIYNQRTGGRPVASGAEAHIDGKSVGTAWAGFNHFRYGASTANELFAALRQGRSVVITVSSEGEEPRSFTLDSVDLDAAYARLRQ